MAGAQGLDYFDFHALIADRSRCLLTLRRLAAFDAGEIRLLRRSSLYRPPRHRKAPH